MTKFSKYKKEYLKAKRMLGMKGNGSLVILGLVALGIVYFVFIKGKRGGMNGGVPVGLGGPSGYVPGGGFGYPTGQIYGLGQAGTEYLSQRPIPHLTEEYSNYP